MYLQLYRSKVQFYRKFGGERRGRVQARPAHGVLCARRRRGSRASHPPAARAGGRVYRRLLAEVGGW